MQMTALDTDPTKKENLKPALIPDPVPPHNISHTFLCFFSFFLGIAGVSSFFAILAEADLFDIAYPDYLYYYYSLVPQNFSIPVSFVLLKVFSWIPPHQNLLI